FFCAGVSDFLACAIFLAAATFLALAVFASLAFFAVAAFDFWIAALCATGEAFACASMPDEITGRMKAAATNRPSRNLETTSPTRATLPMCHPTRRVGMASYPHAPHQKQNMATWVAQAAQASAASATQHRSQVWLNRIRLREPATRSRRCMPGFTGHLLEAA